MSRTNADTVIAAVVNKFVVKYVNTWIKSYLSISITSYAECIG